ncbi:metal ABC transporter solute-binding protein, Zn/Mn family [Thiomicrorhabdus sediminis]|uniref:Manganese transporter n=1 Tax=Thiomicrorhabdus sediminis TaxID=2580412 RepID=A0A4P9K4B1_9GAMM|nr:zinc ABC transporter substrate-binding protein [Thiomicrorhabdus sediminis]QCU89738.1 manganese transporter [Thiomicrorhabdus sediminis]
MNSRSVTQKLDRLVSIFTLALLLWLPGQIQAQNTQPINIVATTGMIADLAKNIGGDSVTVTALMGTGVDPHLYKATQGDLRRILRADIIFYNGLHLEGKMQDIFEKIARKKPVYAISEKLSSKAIIHHGDHYPDPHIWFDVQLWQEAGKRVLEVLQKHDPKNASLYQQNSDRYQQKLTGLHQWVVKQVARVPEQQRILITAHDAFGYFGKAYDIEVMGLQGISTAAEFGLQDIKALKDVISQRNIKAVFVESSVSPKFIQSLVAGLQAEGKSLQIGGELYSDAMGPTGSSTDNYIGMVEHNVNTIVSALIGSKQ